MKRLLTLPALLSMSINLLSQGIQINPLNSRIQVVDDVPDVISLGIQDTLELPFFDDFVIRSGGIPDDTLWTDRDVWITNGATNTPVNAGVAVFDHLDEKGKPYTTINQSNSVFADSLTSQPIDLGQLTPSNNVLLTFFWGSGGLGDAPEIEDSLLLFFKNDTGGWIQQWSVGGNNKVQEMTHAFVRVKDSKFFHNSFQLRFVNYTKATGNLNHFFLDYLAFEKDRLSDTLYKGYKDIGITNSSGSLLREYSQMPYDHFTNSSGLLLDAEHCVYVRNIERDSHQVRYGVNYYNQYGTRIDFIVPSTQGKNVPAEGIGSNCFLLPKLDTLSGANPYIDIEYTASSRGGREMPVNYNKESVNDTFVYTQRFNPWYAYDDGSAEGGISLDYTHLPTNHKGQFALKFNNKKADSLKGIAIYFNRSKEDVSFRSFKLKVWDELSPIGQPDNNDRLLYSMDISKPEYTDSINGFAFIMFDSAIALPTGDFYVGWEQGQKFLLNIGYDNNYRFEDQERFNPNVFHNLLNAWEKGFNIYGTPMMRPIVGQDKDFYFGADEIPLNEISLYPNPADNSISFKNLPEGATVKLISTDGRLIMKSQSHMLDVSFLKAGLYFAQIELGSNIKLIRFVKK